MQLTFTHTSTIPLGDICIKRDDKILEVTVIGFTRSNEIIIEDTKKLPKQMRQMSYANSIFGRRVIELAQESFTLEGVGHGQASGSEGTRLSVTGDAAFVKSYTGQDSFKAQSY
jgi:hypothetical protein